MTTIIKSRTAIVGSVPTFYQVQSLRAFGLRIDANPDGSYSVHEEFDSYKDAISWMKDKAYSMFHNSIIESEEDYNNVIEEIDKYGRMRYDAACIVIDNEGELLIN